MAEKKGKPGYAGRIGNKGAQVVEAAIPQAAAKKGKVIRGTDLRNGRGK